MPSGAVLCCQGLFCYLTLTQEISLYCITQCQAIGLTCVPLRLRWLLLSLARWLPIPSLCPRNESVFPGQWGPRQPGSRAGGGVPHSEWTSSWDGKQQAYRIISPGCPRLSNILVRGGGAGSIICCVGGGGMI